MLNVSVSPHLRAQDTTKSIMRDVAIALIPILAFGIYRFGLSAFIVTALCIITCVLSELLFDIAAKRPITVFDNSALVTGMILAVNLPASVPWYIPVLGGVFAIVVVKMLFGGLGQNFMNPALAGRCFLLISFTGKMSDFAMYNVYSAGLGVFKDGKIKDVLALLSGNTQTAIDAVSGATPLVTLNEGGELDLVSLFLGLHGGCIGEISALAILVGGIYLIARRVISVRIPASYILSTVLFIAVIRLVTGEEVTANYLIGEALSGGLLVGAFFMATDYVTSPITPVGQIIYGIILGFVTAMFRVVGSSAEGVSYAIIICNLIVPIIEKLTTPKPFGLEKAKGDAK